MLKQFSILLCILSLSSIKAAEECDEEVKQEKQFNWSGHQWTVRNEITSDPGPNRWDPNNVWVDSNKRLHLKLTYSSVGWSCAEVYTTARLSFGSYRWFVEGAIDKFDKNVVFGLFTYGGANGTNEIDIEIAKWGQDDPISENLFYTVYPRAANTVDPDQSGILLPDLGGTYTTHRFEWYEDHVSLRSQYGFQTSKAGNLIFANRTSRAFSPYMPIISAPIHMNLWLHKGLPPTNRKEVEIIIHSFEYTKK